MKTRLIILIILISNSITYSQIIKSIGIKSGVTLSDQHWLHTDVSFEYLFNPHAGNYTVLTASFIDKKYWEITTDIGFYQSSSKTELDKDNYYSMYPYFPHLAQPISVVSIGFFTFSPAIKVKKQIKSFTPYLFIGPRIDYYQSKLSNDNANLFKDQYTKKPIWGFNVGEGISYQIKDISISLEYEFLYSYNYVIDKAIDDPAVASYFNISRESLRTYTHVITLGIKYHLN